MEFGIPQQYVDSGLFLLWLVFLGVIVAAPWCIALFYALITLILCPPIGIALCFSYFCLEAAFFTYRYFHIRDISSKFVEVPVPDIPEITALVQRVLGFAEHIDQAEFVGAWFKGASIPDLTKQHIQQFLSFGFFHRFYHEVDCARQQAVEYYMKLGEKHLGLYFKDGNDPTGSIAVGQNKILQPPKPGDIRFMAHTREPLRAIIHPLCVYVWGYVVGACTGWAMWCMGFKRHTSPAGLRYWYRPASQPSVLSSNLSTSLPSSVAAAGKHSATNHVINGFNTSSIHRSSSSSFNLVSIFDSLSLTHSPKPSSAGFPSPLPSPSSTSPLSSRGIPHSLLKQRSAPSLPLPFPLPGSLSAYPSDLSLSVVVEGGEEEARARRKQQRQSNSRTTGGGEKQSSSIGNSSSSEVGNAHGDGNSKENINININSNSNSSSSIDIGSMSVKGLAHARSNSCSDAARAGVPVDESMGAAMDAPRGAAQGASGATMVRGDSSQSAICSIASNNTLGSSFSSSSNGSNTGSTSSSTNSLGSRTSSNGSAEMGALDSLLPSPSSSLLEATALCADNQGYDPHGDPAVAEEMAILCPPTPLPAAKPEEVDGFVFAHGLGLGLTPYLSLVHMMARTIGRSQPLIVPEFTHLALQLSLSSPTVDDVVTGLMEALSCHGIRRGVFAGHSYGTFVLGRLLRRHPEVVASIALSDPVCFLICLPKTLFSFVYKSPWADTLLQTALEAGRWLLCGRELQVARSLRDGFNWHAYQIWPEQMPVNSVVMLSGKDSIVPSHHVKTLLASCPHVRVTHNEEFHHAQFLFSPHQQRSFLTSLLAPLQQKETSH